MAPVKRHAYEAYIKLQAIEYAAENGTRAAARHFNGNESMVRKWRKQESELCKVRKTKLSFRGNKARRPGLEDRVEQLVVEQRTTGRAVSTVTIQQKAKAIAEEMDIEDFQRGPSWCFRFMRRRHLSIRARTTVAQRLPADYQERAAIFRTYCRNKITAPNHITNMDEIPLTFDIPLTHKVEKKGPARWRYAQQGTRSRRSPWFSAATGKRTELWMTKGNTPSQRL
ncbi:hypothetical protein D4764_15G0010840 [Takifugu flavidus]|uniref:HTH CENPB-type domain-containing protein n=1 Tax=Takifugu flavidus TaxID=433684 RepID=A0A5C6P419_9TELE|nr:hypothetical protein D4764_15G0010840 [Takifugu flavidus]